MSSYDKCVYDYVTLWTSNIWIYWSTKAFVIVLVLKKRYLETLFVKNKSLVYKLMLLLCNIIMPFMIVWNNFVNIYYISQIGFEQFITSKSTFNYYIYIWFLVYVIVVWHRYSITHCIECTVLCIDVKAPKFQQLFPLTDCKILYKFIQHHINKMLFNSFTILSMLRNWWL